MKLFKILLIVFITLVVIKISLDYYIKNLENITEKESITKEEINEIFISSLRNFDITEKMIVKNLKNDLDYYKVNYYSDVVIEQILLEIERNFSNKNVEIKSKDSIQNKLTVCKIFSNEKLVLVSYLIQADSLYRNKGNLVFLIKTNNPNEIENDILQSPEPLSFLIVPGKSFQRGLRLIKENNKNYFILINDEIKDLIYKISNNYSKLQIKNTIYIILKTFEHSNRIFIQNDNQWLEQQTLEIILYELKRNKIEPIFTNSFIDLTNEDNTIIEEVNHEIMTIKSDGKKIFIITANQYINLSKIFPSLRKTGYKIVNVSSVL